MRISLVLLLGVVLIPSLASAQAQRGPGTPTINSFHPSDFDINYRPPPSTPPMHATTKSVSAAAESTGDIQTWKSFQFNGKTIWNRPTIFNITPNLVRDSTAGKVFRYRDSVHIQKTPAMESPLSEQIRTPYRMKTWQNLDLLDDRPRPQK